MSILAPLVAALADGSVEVVDLTSPLGPDTVILELPAPFANTKALSTSPVSNFDDAGPAWAWNDLSLGEHAGTHLDAPTHVDAGDGASSLPAQLDGARPVEEGGHQAGRGVDRGVRHRLEGPREDDLLTVPHLADGDRAA